MKIETNISPIGALSIKASFLDYTNNPLELDSSFINEEDFISISENNGFLNGSSHLEGDLLFNTDINVILDIDIDGSVNISDENAAEIYSINDNGELIKNIY
jgi:hypothetical protein